MLKRIWALSLMAGTAAGCTESANRRPEITVLAAASLTEAFTALAEAFERSHSHEVELAFAGSQVHRLQVERGLAGDIFASADAQHIEALVSQNLAEPGRIFARNELVVIVPAHAEPPETALQALMQARRIVVGAETVPAGRYARRLLVQAERSGVDVATVRAQIVSEESNVRLVRSKVEMGEADAALVYRSDAITSDRVLAKTFESPLRIQAEYHHARLSASDDPQGARAWMAFVESETGQQIMAEYGFSTP